MEHSQFFAVEVIGWITIAVIGAKLLYNCCAFVWCTWLAAALGFNLKLAKYGKWAVVTGATDGLGKQYALKLASMGLDVVLISRTQAKLDRVADEIMGHYKSVEVKTVAVDFTQGETIYDELRRQLHDLEIGVLVNNVGMAGGFGHLFAADANPQYIFDTINCNVLSATTMSHIVLSGMEQRRRGVIINVASLAGVSVAPYHAVYGATKAFLDQFSHSLAFEYGGKGIVVQSVLPGVVATNMTGMSSGSFTTPDAKRFVEAALRTVGVERRSSCFWFHRFMLYVADVGYFFVPDVTGFFVKTAVKDMGKNMNFSI